MAHLIYTLCTLTSLACAALLLTSYKRTGARLLLWSGLCFAGLTISNAITFMDLSLVAEASLYRWRLGVAATSMLLLQRGEYGWALAHTALHLFGALALCVAGFATYRALA